MHRRLPAGAASCQHAGRAGEPRRARSRLDNLPGRGYAAICSGANGCRSPGTRGAGGCELLVGPDREKLPRLLWTAAFAAAMAYVEAAVVVYLRFLYYPEGFFVKDAGSLGVVPAPALRIELGREAATIVMLGAVALLASKKSWWERLAFFMWAFAFWDIFYYVWLRVFLGWPPGVMTLDVLFLIPDVWVAPVVLPLVASGIMMAAALAILRRT